MKKRIHLKLVIISISMIIFSTNIFAQIIVTNPQIVARPVYDSAYFSNPSNFTLTGTETQTVGALAPYYVLRDSNVNGPLFNASSFEWTWTGITGLQDKVTNTSITSGSLVGYNMVVATMPNSAGSATLTVQEQSNPIVGTGCMDPTGQSLSITVVSQPTFIMPTIDLGGCGISAGSPYNIAATFTGIAPIYVNYTITGINSSGDTIGGAGESYQVTLDSLTAGIIIDPTQLAHLCGASTVSETSSGVYTVTVNSVWDAVSFKAINSNNIATTAPVSGLATINIDVYPTPTTSPIKFIKVLP